mmetsp:Transcript_16655/g.65042  ORF Transcript_16655/g.65042 Transcript_16655/m.65042 type:complete len:266 (+) Transcript_16655:1417-2214(+)
MASIGETGAGQLALTPSCCMKGLAASSLQPCSCCGGWLACWKKSSGAGLPSAGCFWNTGTCVAAGCVLMERKYWRVLSSAEISPWRTMYAPGSSVRRKGSAWAAVTAPWYHPLRAMATTLSTRARGCANGAYQSRRLPEKASIVTCSMPVAALVATSHLSRLATGSPAPSERPQKELIAARNSSHCTTSRSRKACFQKAAPSGSVMIESTMKWSKQALLSMSPKLGRAAGSALQQSCTSCAMGGLSHAGTGGRTSSSVIDSTISS